ncbi:hypothetical protein JGG87_25010 [Salmonella enterica subsp. enterica serovar Typhimurium]|nr:hypothetical protein [Salmonella enterica subsp. enterica serovar Typhimurium]
MSRVYREYIDSGKTIPARANCRGQQRVDERGHRRLARIVTADRPATVQDITRQFNAGALKRVSSHTIQNHLLAMGYRSHRPTRVPLLTAHHRAQRLAWARDHRHWTLDMRKILPGLMSRDSRWYMRMAGYEYGANHMKRWILLASRVLFKLVGVAFSSGDCLRGLKWDPWYV